MTRPAPTVTVPVDEDDTARKLVFGQVDLSTAELEMEGSIYDGFAAAIMVKGQPRTVALTREYQDAVQLMAIIQRDRATLPMILDLHRSGVLSEGQIVTATGLDRVEVRARVDALSAAPAAPQAAGVGEAAARLDRFASGASVTSVWAEDRFDDMTPFECIRADLLSALRAPSREPEGGAVTWSYDLTSCPRSEPFLIAYADGDVRMGHYLDNSKTSVPWQGIRPLFGAERWDAKIVAWANRPALATREEAPADNVTILITKAQRDAAMSSGKKLNDWIGGILQRAVEEAPAEAREIGAEYDAAAHCVTLPECPPGLFLWNGTLGFKSEYGAMEPDDATNGKHWKVGNRADAYCADSGEYFWGGTSNHDDRAKLLVYPIAAETVAMVASHGPSALRAQPQAREDAQPFMFAYEDVDKPGEWRAFRHQIKRADGSICPGRPLHTHPDPDALRVAVEAYLTAVDDLEIPVMSPSLGLHRKEVASQARNKLRQALAALQAEQKGGA